MNNLAINNNIDRSQDKLWHWQAHLQLILAHNQRGTTLNRCRHNGPLYVQKPFYPEGKDHAHIYLLHPPGGLVSGDHLAIDITVKENAKTVVTTPGAARLYRARDIEGNAESSPVQKQNIQLSVESGASMEWFPMETIVYNGAAAELTTHIDLAEDSTYMGWEITCLGLPASQALMTSGYFKQSYKITQQGLPVFIDRLYYDAQHSSLLNNMAGMQSKTVSGFFIAGRFTCTQDQQQALLEELRECLAQQNIEALFAVTFMQGFCIARYLGESANQARDGFTLLWELLRPELMQRKACHPRIWLT